MKMYYVPGARRIKGQRLTIADRIGIWKRNRRLRKEMIWPWN